jgi:MarR family 2-MHQ and catechol resistance regulon transcriptional repressor
MSVASSIDDNLSLKMFVVLSRAYRSVFEHSQRDIHRHGLNPTEFAIMELLYHKGPMPLQQIGGRVLLTSGSITYVIDQLSKKGYLTRKPCEKDRRVTYASLLDKGTQLIESIFPDHIKAIELAVSGLNNSEKESAINLLKKLGLEAEDQF